MTQLQIIRKLWSVVYDLIFYARGDRRKTMEEIETRLFDLEKACSQYADEEEGDVT